MAQDAVNKIMSAEKTAADKVSEAEVSARQIVSDADKEAEKAVGAAIADAEHEGEKLSVLAKGKMDAAAALIAERVVNG